MDKDFLTGKLIELKTDIQRWLRIAPDESQNGSDPVQRNAEKLIWKLQERYGYSHVRQDRDR